MTELGPTRYARHGLHHLAYRTGGTGRDVLMQMPGFIPMSMVDDRFGKHWFDRIMAMGRPTIFDRAGVGESDPTDLDDPPSLDELADGAVAVLDAARVERTAFFATYDVGPVAIRCAIRHPERIDSLVLVHAFVSWLPTEDLPHGVAPEYNEQYEAIVERGKDSGLDLTALVAPSIAHDDEFRRWWDDLGRRGASPAAAIAITESQRRWDVRQDLASVACPTLVVHRSGNLFVHVEHARYTAERIPDARLVEVPGIDHLTIVGDVDSMLDPVEEFLTGRRAGSLERALAALLFTDIVGSTRRAAESGDRAWKQILEHHDDIAVRSVVVHGGELTKTTGDGILAVFPTPGAAIHAAADIRDRVKRLDLEIRAGVHAGEIERIGDDVSGMAVNIAARVMDRAGPGEIVVSGAVPPLMAGADIDFDDRGAYELKGVPGTWQLLAVRV